MTTASPIDYAELLAGVEIFGQLPETWSQQLGALLQEERYEDDELIFKAGDKAVCMYVIAQGEVCLFTDTVGEAIEMRAMLGRGGAFGEIGVLERSGRSLSARASGATILLRLDGSDLVGLAKAHEPFGRELCRVALGYSLENRAARVELARRREARIRIGSAVEVRTAQGEPLPAVLENLSLGGACLSGMPSDWRVEETTLLSIGVDPTTALFSAYAKVAWRRDGQVGLKFTQTMDDHEIRIPATVYRLVAEAKGEYQHPPG